MLTREYPAFASDMATVLAAAGATVEFLYANGYKTVTARPTDRPQPLRALALRRRGGRGLS